MTTPEKKAQKLWANFTPNKQNSFWKKYEALQEESISLQHHSSKASADHYLKATKSTDKQVFHPPLLVFAYLIPISIAAIVFVVKFSSLLAGGFIFAILILRFVGSFPAFRSFEVTQSHLIIKDTYTFSKKTILLEQIKCIGTNKDVSSFLRPDPSTHCLFITLNDDSLQFYPYKLSYKKHQAFFQEFIQRGIQVDKGEYTGYSF
ncbi:hypothetical protein BKI52_43350 [marine bacterium AO1-C]|nr:hypothetical protein BKI52_43350 [marine bacterium AO1-C]